MKKFAVLLAVLALAFSCCALADADIVAQGTATITADPDLARVNCGAGLRASSIGEAQEKVAAIVAAATENLEAMGIAKEDIVTDYYGCYPVYDYNGTQEEPQIIGYQASHSLVVTCRDITRLDKVLGIMTESGMTEFNGISFDCTNRHDLYLEALKSAVRGQGDRAGLFRYGLCRSRGRRCADAHKARCRHRDPGGHRGRERKRYGGIRGQVIRA